MSRLTRIGHTAKRHPAAFCCRVLICLPLTLLITLLDMASLIADALRQELRNRFPYDP